MTRFHRQQSQGRRGFNLGRRRSLRLPRKILQLTLGIIATSATLGLSSSGISGINATVSSGGAGQSPDPLGSTAVQAQEVKGATGAIATNSNPLQKHHSQVSRDRLNQRMAELRQGQQKWLEINVATQRLIAWEGGKPVYAIIVSTGKRSTPTHPGIFSIYRKQHPERMRGRGYDIPNVPHAMYYHRGYAIHGAFWHNRFGTPVSHGCTNVAPNHARWLYNWASVGTPIVVHQ